MVTLLWWSYYSKEASISKPVTNGDIHLFLWQQGMGKRTLPSFSSITAQTGMLVATAGETALNIAEREGHKSLVAFLQHLRISDDQTNAQLLDRTDILGQHRYIPVLGTIHQPNTNTNRLNQDHKHTFTEIDRILQNSSYYGTPQTIHSSPQFNGSRVREFPLS
ncbi:hypothetical protein K440DRAFT_618178 [Wilcoxina mikolae CBS 423.85]|nr:hypothetical protein K440DRAFT_618178 [Wilcoxina mikolae CBS 423.85]